MRIRRIIQCLALLAVALLCWWVPHYLKQPGIFNHKLLVATDKMHNSPFDKSVILVLEQDSHGALGLVLNKPLGPGAPYAGGPNEQNAFYTLHTLDLSSKTTIKIAELNIGYTKGDTFMMMIGHMGDRPQEHMIFRGYMSWKRGQLPDEVTDGDWKAVKPTTALIFHTKSGDMWAAAMKLPEVRPE